MSVTYYSNVLAIVTTWNPNFGDFKTALASYNEQCIVLIVDNGSCESIRENLQSLVTESCRLLALPANFGIATAINKGIDYFKNEEFEYVLLLDQDSLFNEHTLEDLVNASRLLKAEGVAQPVVGTLPIDKRSGVAIGMYRGLERLKKSNCVAMESLYTSGMLVPFELARKVPQRDEFFIDYVDTEWCYRARSYYGATFYTVPSATIMHQVGEGVINIPYLRSGRPLLVHKPIRQYFQSRNAIWMAGYSFIPFNRRVKIVLRCLARVTLIALTVKPRYSRLMNIFCAVADGISRRPAYLKFLLRDAGK